MINSLARDEANAWNFSEKIQIPALACLFDISEKLPVATALVSSAKFVFCDFSVLF